MAGAQILLVEDEKTLCDIIARNLQARGHQVSVAMSYQSAMEYLHAATFDLIVLDINLPDYTGWDVLRSAQEDGSIQPLKFENDEEKLPVVILSAVRVSPRRLVEFHPLAYLPKPFPLEALIRIASEAVERRDAGVHVEGPPEEKLYT